MTAQTVTVELSESLYHSAQRLARVTKRPLAEILAESLTHTLPPLDDVPEKEAEALAYLSTLDDAALWQEAEAALPPEQQERLGNLLSRQNAGELTEDETTTLHTLMAEYGRLLVRKSHAWLLLARRGYKVPLQES